MQRLANHPSPSSDLTLSLQLGKPLLQEVDVLILEIIRKEIPLIHEVAKHLITSGGKRLRPLLTLLCAMGCGYEGPRHIHLAAVVEFMHTATLLHDDVVDESHLRRGTPTANDIWGNKSSVLVGDFLLSQAFRLMIEDGSLEVLDILSDAAVVISKGEVLQLGTERNIDTSMEMYTEVIQAKTAKLFAAACEIAPVIAGKSERRPVYQAYGMAVGVAFQAVDDVLDYFADQHKLGKTIGDDFREKKVTLPVILLKEKISNQDKPQFNAFFSEDYTQKPDDFKQMLSWMNHYEIKPECDQFIAQYCTKAEQALAQMPPSDVNNALGEIIQYGASRIH